MFENIQYDHLPVLASMEHQLLKREGEILEEEEPILEEHLIEVYLNDVLIMKLICLAQYLEEMVFGRLLTEGFLHSMQEVESIYICEYGSKAKVYLTQEAIEERKRTRNMESKDAIETVDHAEAVETTPTCCTGNRIISRMFSDSEKIKAVTPIFWEPEWIFHLADTFAEGMPLHKETFATHSCFIAVRNQLIFGCEDIGRHNALDKVIGYCLLHEIDLKECTVYSSGRIPTDMVSKVIRAGIPILCSKAAPTKQAIELAREYQVTLICQARRDRMKRYA